MSIAVWTLKVQTILSNTFAPSGPRYEQPVMNVVCYERVCYERVCYERSLLWTGRLWTWSVMNGLFWTGLFWTGLFWTDTLQNIALQLCIIATTNVLGKTYMFIFL